MRTAYLSTLTSFSGRFCSPSPRLSGPGRCTRQSAGGPAQAQDWNDGLTQLQTLYEEQLASQWLECRTPILAGSPQELSAREITRDLAGWGPPQARALSAGGA